MTAKQLTIRPQYSARQKRESVELYLILAPVLIHIFIFCIIPLYGVIIAFQDYAPGSAFFALDGSTKWVGFKHFVNLFKGPYFKRLLQNTLTLSSSCLLFGFPLPILLALMLNELSVGKFKKTVQTLSYLPYFISNVIVASIVLTLINTDGPVNKLIQVFGMRAIPFNIKPRYFTMIYTITSIWRSFGWNSILYLAAMSAIDSTLYEAVKIDGGNRIQQMWYITLPGIMPTIVLMLIMSVGGLLSSNTEMILLLYNPSVYETADVFGTYVYRAGLLTGQFSFGSSVSLFITVINFTLVFCANLVSRKVSDHSIW